MRFLLAQLFAAILLSTSALATTVAIETKGEIVDAKGIDGCGMLIQMPNGKFLQPTNLAPAFAKSGLKVTVKYKERRDLMSVCMRGLMVDIVSIEEDKRKKD